MRNVTVTGPGFTPATSTLLFEFIKSCFRKEMKTGTMTPCPQHLRTHRLPGSRQSGTSTGRRTSMSHGPSGRCLTQASVLHQTCVHCDDQKVPYERTVVSCIVPEARSSAGRLGTTSVPAVVVDVLYYRTCTRSGESATIDIIASDWRPTEPGHGTGEHQELSYSSRWAQAIA